MKRQYKFMAMVSISMISLLVSSFILGPGPTMNENSFQINGDGYTNQLVKLGIKAHEFENNLYAKGTYNYFQEYQNMTLRISGMNTISSTTPITGIHVDFTSFTKPGVYTTDSAVSFSVFFKKDIPTNDYEQHYMMESDGIITINTYEPIGGLIEGTFSGTFTKVRFNKESGSIEDLDVQVKITNGKFSVIHTPDFHWDAPASTGAEPEGFKEKKKKSKKS